MSTYMALRNTLCVFKELKNSDIELICSYFTLQKLNPGEHFQLANEPVTRIGFILSGIVRGYITDSDNNETIKFFMQPDQFIVDVQGLKGFGNSYLSLQAIQHCEILTINTEEVNSLYLKIPKLEKVIDLLCIKALLLINQIGDSFKRGTSKQKYQSFLKLYPQIANQIPLKYVALFLDVTPQSFSRIRRGIR